MPDADPRPAPAGGTLTWRHVPRGGTDYWRVVGQDWADPADTSFSKKYGGRWNPAGTFGVLYLNATLEVARANARLHLAKNGLEVDDLKPGAGPDLVAFSVDLCAVVDIVTGDGVRACGLPDEYPDGVDHPPCQKLGAAFHAAGETGLACRSASECPGPGAYVGEEVPLFDHADGTLPAAGTRVRFDEWYFG